LVPFLLAINRAFNRSALKLPLRVVIVLDRAAMPPTNASGPIEPALRIERVVEGGHDGMLHRYAGARTDIARELAMDVPINWSE
jgi:hypothetical protein